jgi:hypothetical protein
MLTPDKIKELVKAGVITADDAKDLEVFGDQQSLRELKGEQRRVAEEMVAEGGKYGAKYIEHNSAAEAIWTKAMAEAADQVGLTEFEARLQSKKEAEKSTKNGK